MLPLNSRRCTLVAVKIEMSFAVSVVNSLTFELLDYALTTDIVLNKLVLEYARIFF
jgi:hypothetical protein